jgi:hypothetical protein
MDYSQISFNAIVEHVPADSVKHEDHVNDTK